MTTCNIYEVIGRNTGEVWWLVPDADVKQCVVEAMELIGPQVNNIVVLPPMMADGMMISDGGG